MEIVTYNSSALDKVKNALNNVGVYCLSDNDSLLAYTSRGFYVGRIVASDNMIKLNGYTIDLDDERLLFEMANVDVYHNRRRELMVAK